MIKDKALELVAALRSGDYNQGKAVLQLPNGKACCLGVACLISGIERRTDEGIFITRPFRFGSNKEMYNLPAEAQILFGFHNSRGSRKDGDPVIIKELEYSCLAEANDAGVSFTEIANYIEENWKYL